MSNKKERDREITTRAMMSNAKKDALLSIVIRDKSAFEQAYDVLKVEHFDDFPVYQLLWHTVTGYYDQYKELPDREILEAELQQQIDYGDYALDEPQVEELNTFVELAFDPEYLNQQQSPGPARQRWVANHLRQLLEEVVVREARQDLQHHSIPSDIADWVSQYSRRTAAISAIGVDDGNDDLFPPGWEEEIRLDFMPIGISSLSKFMGGGQVAGEVYGILGPFGSCKTTLGVMLWVEGGKSFIQEAQNHQAGDGRKPKISFFVSYEEPLNGLRQRSMSYAAGIPLPTLIEMKSREDLSTSDNLKDYENKKFKRQIENNEPVFGERERMEDAANRLRPHLAALDMTGRERPGDGNGGISEIKAKIRAVCNRRESQCGLIVIDYVGAMLRRAINSAGGGSAPVEREAFGFSGQIMDVPLMAKADLADEFDCPVWLIHQLDGQANSKAPTAQITTRDIAGSKSFTENLNFGFAVGNPTKENLAMLFCLKHRRQPPREASIIKIDGAWARVLDVDNKYVYQPGPNQIVSRETIKRVIAGPAEESTGSSGSPGDVADHSQDENSTVETDIE